MIPIRIIRLLAAFAVALVLLSCDNDNPTTPPADNNITIGDNFFNPPTLTVAVGRPVVWRHEGATQHTVTSGSPTSNPGGLFDSGLISPGSGFQFTFNAPGTFPYFCRVHGVAMTGTITVQ
jgi:plastocyanin